MTVAFVYLLIAAALQLAWLYNIKSVNKEIFKKIKKGPLISIKNIKAITPIFLYIILGVSNVIFLTWSMNTIPPSIAYALWTGMVIGVAAIIDQLLSKKPLKPAKFVFIFIIIIGIIGLRLSTQ